MSCAGPTVQEYLAEKNQSDNSIPTTSRNKSNTSISSDEKEAGIQGQFATTPNLSNNLAASPPLPDIEAKPTPQGPGAAVASVNHSSLALRRHPKEGAPVVGSVRQGMELAVSALSRDGKWVRLEAPVASGGRGWVAARHVAVHGEITGILITDGLESAAASGALSANEAIVDAGTRRLRLRNGPGVAYDTVFFAFTGESFTILDSTEDGMWIHLSSPALNAEGWANRRYLRLAGDPIPTPKPTPTSTPTVLFTPPTRRPTVAVQTLTTPTPTLVEESLGDESSDDDVKEPRPQTPWPTTPPDTVTVVTDGTRLRVRAAPDEQSEIVGYVYNREIYPLLEVSADGTWVHIALEGNEDGGWVADRFVITPNNGDE